MESASRHRLLDIDCYPIGINLVGLVTCNVGTWEKIKLVRQAVGNANPGFSRANQIQPW